MKLVFHGLWVSLALAVVVAVTATVSAAVAQPDFWPLGAPTIALVISLWFVVFAGLVALAHTLRMVGRHKNKAGRQDVDPRLVLLAAVLAFTLGLIALVSVAIRYLTGALALRDILFTLAYFVALWSIGVALAEVGLRRGWRAVMWVWSHVDPNR